VNIPPIDRGQADQFLQLLGKNPATARLRAFPHRLNPDRFDAKTNPNGIRARAGTYDLSRASLWQREGRGLYLVVNDGGDRDDAITGCVAFWVEWDNRPVEWQLQGWREFGLGEPSISVTTGGKSVHQYWVLHKPISPERWRPIQQALISVTAADPVNKNPSRVMRLPGAYYMGPDGNASGQSKIHASNDRRYTVEEVEGWLTAQPAAAPARPIPAGSLSPVELPPRPADALKKALLKLPKFEHGAGQYQNLVDLAMRLHVEIGAAAAEQLLAETCAPSITDLASYFNGTPNKIHRGSIWAHLRDELGIDIRRHDLKKDHIPDARKKVKSGPHDPQEEPAGEWWDEEAAEAYWTAKSGPITVEQVRQRYQAAIESGASRADLETERLALAAASDLHPAALRDLFKSLELEQEAAHAITAETRAIRDAGEQKAMAEGLRLDYLLPPSLAQALAIRTKWLPADDVAAIMAYLVCISGLVKLGTEIVACPAAGYKVPLNLYVCLVAKSGAKKSPLSRKLVSEPTHTLRLDLARQHDRAVQNWAEQNRGVKPAERTDPPQPAYISVTDATAEALTHQLQVQENRGLPLLWERDELAGLIGGLNAYRGGRGGDSEQLLEAYDGSGFRSLRIATTGGGRSYQRCHLSIWGTIQPAVLGELVKGGDASGLWARFAFVPLPEVVVPLAEHQTQSDLEASQWAEGLLMDICDQIYRLPRSSLALSPEGRSAFIAYEARCQRDALDAVIPAQGALMAKSAGKALRLAGLIHLLHQACPDGQHSNTIGAEAISKATTLTDYLNSWALGLHASAADGPNDLMQLIHKVAKAFGNQAVGWREIYSRLSKTQRRDSDAGAAAQAMEALAALGVGEATKGARGATMYRATGDL
jgi:hypothetical protein